MNQALYAHMNNKRKMKKKKFILSDNQKYKLKQCINQNTKTIHAKSGCYHRHSGIASQTFLVEKKTGKNSGKMFPI
jgi:hypothetical protein